MYCRGQTSISSMRLRMQIGDKASSSRLRLFLSLNLKSKNFKIALESVNMWNAGGRPRLRGTTCHIAQCPAGTSRKGLRDFATLFGAQPQ